MKHEQFGTKELPKTTNKTSSTIVELFMNNSDTYYTQKELVTYMNKTNPCINKILRNLVQEKIVERTKVNSKYYYKFC